MITVHAYQQSWPIKGSFNISRGAKKSADVIVVEIRQDNNVVGWGEAVPYAHYGESVEGSITAINAMLPAFCDPAQGNLDRTRLIEMMPAGAARNALDCALWDYEARTLKQPVWQLANMPQPTEPVTAYTISLDTPEKMGASAKENAHRPLLKLKLGHEEDLACVVAVSKSAHDSDLIVDANEGWSFEKLTHIAPRLQKLGVSMVEQPMPASEDDALKGYTSPVALCADESCRTLTGLPDLAQKYEYINIKLDKTGGLTHALSFVEKAVELNLKLMIGSMVGTSLSIAPALVLSGVTDFVDLDGPILLSKDRSEGFKFERSTVKCAAAGFWGGLTF